MKLAVITTNAFYLQNFINKFSKSDSDEVKVYSQGQDPNLNIWKLKELCDWADIIWCEFCEHPMALVTNYVQDKPIVARMWRHEIYDPYYINSIKWNKVNLLLVAGEALAARFKKFRNGKVEPEETISFYLPSVDTSRFVNKPREYNSTKICMVGDVTPRKRQLDAIQLLLEIDGVKLSIAGDLKNKEYVTQIQEFIKGNNLESRVDVYGKLDHNILHEFFQDHDVYLSMSLEEASHRATAEAIACGCFPILSWSPSLIDSIPFSKNIHSTFSSMLASLKEWDGLSKEHKTSISYEMSSFASKNFSDETESMYLYGLLSEILRKAKNHK